MARNGEIREQQKLFVDEYLKLRKKNQTKAAINAGYSAKSAQSQASQLLMNPKVIEYLKERESQLDKELREEFVFDALEARKVMYEIMNDYDSPPAVRLNAAKDFLDRAGFKPIDKQETEISGSIELPEPIKDIFSQIRKHKGDDN